MKIKPILFALTISLFAYNCSSDSNEDLEDNNDSTEEVTGTTEDPLTNGAPFPLLTFDQVSGRAGRVISRMNSMAAPMPPSGLVNTSIRAQMDQWRTDGLLEN